MTTKKQPSRAKPPEEKTHWRQQGKGGRRTPRGPAKTNDETNLTQEQEHYCRLRATGMNMLDASIAIDKSVHTGRKWEKNQAVIARIAMLNDRVSESLLARNEIDRNWVMHNLVKVAERCMQEEAVLDREGNPTGEYQFDSAGALKALNLIGLEVGMFKRDQAQININTQINTLPQDHLREMAKRLALDVLGSGVVIDAEPDALT